MPFNKGKQALGTEKDVVELNGVIKRNNILVDGRKRNSLDAAAGLF